MLTDKFMHIHVPRTGGTMLRTFLADVPGTRSVCADAHLPYRAMAARCKEVPPAFVFTRNPWSYLVSQWCWLSHIGQAGMKDVPFEVYFDEVRENMVKGPRNPLNLGSITSAWRYLEADRAQYVGRFENLCDDVVRILCEIMDADLEDWIRARIRKAGFPRKALTPDGKAHGPHREYYTQEMALYVAAWDAEFIDRFGYKF